MAKKIYSKTFITSKNPTEWSFTWIAFNNNPFPSSVFAPIRSTSSTFSRFLYQPTKYLFMVLDSILRSSVLLYPNMFVSGTEGTNINKSCSLRHQWKRNHPIFHIFISVRLTKNFLHLSRVNISRLLLVSIVLFFTFLPFNSLRRFSLSSAFSHHTATTLLLLHCLNGSYILTI